MLSFILFFFFFQAEDGIRDWSVTGVQTCALPICPGNASCASSRAPSSSLPTSSYSPSSPRGVLIQPALPSNDHMLRSEERRVGKECRARWSTYRYKKEEADRRCEIG